MLPDFETDGNLPAGVHYAEWPEFSARFGTASDQRRYLISGLEVGLRDLEKAVQAAAVSRTVTDVTDSKILTEVQTYREAAAVAADMFNAVTNLNRPTNLDPSLT